MMTVILYRGARTMLRRFRRSTWSAGVFQHQFKLAVGLAAAVCLCIAQSVRADTLVYFDEDGGSKGPRGFYSFDTATGQSALLSTVSGTERFFAMDFRPSDGTLFAVGLRSGGLWTINMDTGTPNLVGTLNPAIDRPEGIAFQPGTGTLFVGSLGGGLYQVDPSNATAVLIGQSGRELRGLSFSPDGSTLFAYEQGSGRAYSLNPNTGAATLLSDGIPSVVPEDTTFTPSKKFYGTDYTGTIYSLDPTDGKATAIGTTGLGYGLLGMAAEPHLVPEPGTLTLLALGGLLIAGVRRKIARRR